MTARLISAPRAELRLREAHDWLASRPKGEEAVVIAANTEAANEQVRALAVARGAAFGIHRTTLGRLAGELAKLELAQRELAVIGTTPIEALCARIVARLGPAGKLGRLVSVIDQPHLARALARTLLELRMAGVTDVPGRPELTESLAALADELACGELADRALVYEIAAADACSVTSHPLLGHHLLLLDVPLRTAIERRLLAAVAARARTVLATVPNGDTQSEQVLRDVLHVDATELETGACGDALDRVQRRLFAPSSEVANLDDSVEILSAPGETRECVEIVRRILREAECGVRFDRIAVLLRSPKQYRVHLEEALVRAGIPACFECGTVMPDPSGRAFLALLSCANEGLSAQRFAEYVSLSEVPDAIEGTPPAAVTNGELWIPPDEEILPTAVATTASEPWPEPPFANVGAVIGGSLRAPWRWERLLVEGAVIGGRERWARRLDGLEAKLRLDDGEESRESRERMLADLMHLRRFALPLLDDLAALPVNARWGEWLDALSALATRALRRPERVLAVLSAFAPMRDIGPVTLQDIQFVLHERLTDLVVPPTRRRFGSVLVAPIDAVRGLAFDVVFVPGLAERMFPQKVAEDPLLPDTDREALGFGVQTRADRLRDERLLLRLAIGAACRRVVLSYPRIDLDQGRPRVPSFYCLEILEAAEGRLPGFDELARRADVMGAARVGWPAPGSPLEAIDEAEHDLALLGPLVHGATPETVGAATYLLSANRHLARALRARARRWQVSAWKPADGLIVTTDEGRMALSINAPSVRSFSPAALEELAACPYRFALRTIVKLEPREPPEPVERLGALERGSLIHAVQFELLGELRDADLLPVRAATLNAAQERLDAALDRVAARYWDDLCPPIERVWRDGIAAIRADLREWLQYTARDSSWTPRRFELAFGLGGREGRDPASADEPVRLEIGLALRGSIDLVEENLQHALRATDHKTGIAKIERGAIIAGGRSLQPVLYALALEKLFPGVEVAGGRLFYCTIPGDFQEVVVPLDVDARNAAQVISDTLAHCVAGGFFPAAPAKDECKYCDYRTLCGPYEEIRIKNKVHGPLAQLKRLRDMR